MAAAQIAAVVALAEAPAGVSPRVCPFNCAGSINSPCKAPLNSNSSLKAASSPMTIILAKKPPMVLVAISCSVVAALAASIRCIHASIPDRNSGSLIISLREAMRLIPGCATNINIVAKRKTLARLDVPTVPILSHRNARPHEVAPYSLFAAIHAIITAGKMKRSISCPTKSHLINAVSIFA